MIYLRSITVLFIISLTYAPVCVHVKAQDQRDYDSSTSNQRRDELIEKLREDMSRNRKEFEKLFNDDFFQKVDKVFKNSFGNIHGGPDISDIQKIFDSSVSALTQIQGPQSSWEDSTRGAILKVKGQFDENSKFDVKVAKGMVTISGQLNSSSGRAVVTSSKFKKSLNLPANVNADAMSLEKVDDGIIIIFPWKKGKATEKVKKDDNDLTI